MAVTCDVSREFRLCKGGIEEKGRVYLKGCSQHLKDLDGMELYIYIYIQSARRSNGCPPGVRMDEFVDFDPGCRAAFVEFTATGFQSR